MKTMQKIIFVFSFFSAAVSFAQDLSLQDAINSAKDNNPSIRQLRLRYNSAEWEVTKTMATYMPKLSINGQHLFDQKFQNMLVDFQGQTIPFPVLMPYTEVDLRANYTIFEGFAGMHQYEAAKLEEQASQLELSRAEFQLERDVRSRFFMALGAQTLQEVAAQRVKNLDEHLNMSKRYVQNGVTTNYDVLRIEVQLADAKTDELQAEDNVVLAKDRLAQVIGTSSLPQKLVGDFPAIDRILIPTDFASAENQREDIQAKMLREQSSHDKSLAANAWWSPKINLYAEKQFYNYADHDWQYSDKYNDAYFVGLNFTWNIFDGGASLAQQKQAANQAAIEVENTRSALLQLPQELELWKRKYLHSVSVFRSNSLSIAKAQEAVRQATNGRKAGTRTINDVLDTELELSQTKAKVVQAQMDAVEALGNLELAAGKKLYEASSR